MSQGPNPYQRHVSRSNAVKCQFSRCDPCLKKCFDTLRCLKVQTHISANRSQGQISQEVLWHLGIFRGAKTHSGRCRRAAHDRERQHLWPRSAALRAVMCSTYDREVQPLRRPSAMQNIVISHHCKPLYDITWHCVPRSFDNLWCPVPICDIPCQCATFGTNMWYLETVFGTRVTICDIRWYAVLSRRQSLEFHEFLVRKQKHRKSGFRPAHNRCSNE